MTKSQLHAECQRLYTAGETINASMDGRLMMLARLTKFANKKILRTNDQVQGLMRLFSISERQLRAELAHEDEIQRVKQDLIRKWNGLTTIKDVIAEIELVNEKFWATIGSSIALLAKIRNRLVKWLNSKSVRTTADIEDLSSLLE